MKHHAEAAFAIMILLFPCISPLASETPQKTPDLVEDVLLHVATYLEGDQRTLGRFLLSQKGLKSRVAGHVRVLRLDENHRYGGLFKKTGYTQLSPQLSPQNLTQWLASFPNLTFLSLPFIHDLAHHAPLMRQIAALTNLRQLCVIGDHTGPSFINASSLEILETTLQHLPHLESFGFQGTIDDGIRGIDYPFERNIPWRSSDLVGVLETLPQNVTSLQLDIRDVTEPEFLENLSACTQLIRLNLSANTLTNPELLAEALAHLTKLTFLELASLNADSSETAWWSLKPLKQMLEEKIIATLLTALHVGAGLDEQEANALSSCRNLRHLSVNLEYSTDPSQQLAQLVGQMQHLEILDLSIFDAPRDLSCLTEFCPKLQSLGLHLEGVGRDGFCARHFLGLPHLTTLDLTKTTLNPESLMELKYHEKLIFLHLCPQYVPRIALDKIQADRRGLTTGWQHMILNDDPLWDRDTLKKLSRKLAKTPLNRGRQLMDIRHVIMGCASPAVLRIDRLVASDLAFYDESHPFWAFKPAALDSIINFEDCLPQ